MMSNAEIRRHIMDRWKRKFHYHWCKIMKGDCLHCKPKVQDSCEKLRAAPWIEWNFGGKF